MTETPDPLAGSYYVESLTNELEAAAWAYLDEIEALGGTLAAIERGFQQREIQEAAYRVQRAIECRRPGRRRRQPVPRRRGQRRRRPSGSTPTASGARSSASGGSGPSGRPRRWTAAMDDSRRSPAARAT